MSAQGGRAAHAAQRAPQAKSSGTLASVFDDHLSSWLSWQQEPWARVRYAVVAAVLDRHLQQGNPLRVLDVGGGDGMDSLRLAAAGHHVTILDYSLKMLDEARKNAAALGVDNRVELVAGGVTDPAGHRLGEYDIVLCHFVIQYLADPRQAIDAVVAAARAGGLVSLMAPNPVSEVLAEAVRRKDPRAALAMLDAPTFHAVAFDHDVARIDWRSAARQLRTAGADVIGRYGCRCVVDLMDEDGGSLDPERFGDILRLELAVCSTSPYRDVARAWQLVAHRR